MAYCVKLLLVTGIACLSLVPLTPSPTLAQVSTGQSGPSSAQRVVSPSPAKPKATPSPAAVKDSTTSPTTSNSPNANPPAAETTTAGTPLKLVGGLVSALGVLGVLVMIQQRRSKRQTDHLHRRLSVRDNSLSSEQDSGIQAGPTQATRPADNDPSFSVSQPGQANHQPASVEVSEVSSRPAGSEIKAAVTPTTRLAKVDIVEALIGDLHSSDAAKRRKAIWDLGQRGDSRAVQPLVDLIVDSDSQQRSLILAAVSEISTRTLKPMNRALLMSLQDESADVRKNAIRDITRIYDLMTQVSQLLQYAASDTDEEVQETARWALTQLNRLRTVPELDQSNHSTDQASLKNRREQ